MAYERLHEEKENGNASFDPLSHPEVHTPSSPVSANCYKRPRDEEAGESEPREPNKKTAQDNFSEPRQNYLRDASQDVERPWAALVKALAFKPSLRLSYEANVEPSLAKLQARLGLSEAQLQKVVVALPPVLGLSYEANVEPSLAKLQARLGLSEAQLQKVVVASPSVLSFSYEANVEPSLAKLQARLGLSEAQLQKVVVALPSVLGYSYEANVEPSLAKLQARLGLSEAQLLKVVVALPSVLSLSYEANVEPSLAKLQARLRLSEAQLQKVVVALPSVLSLSYEANVEPKLAFLEAELGFSLDDSVVNFPPLLGYSLAKRFRPRVEACRAVGEQDLSVVLSRVTMPDARFYPSIGLDEWDQFLPQ